MTYLWFFSDIFWEIYSFLRESKYTAVFLWINNEVQYVPLLWLSSIFMTYDPSNNLSKSCLKKNAIKPRFVVKIHGNLDIV